MARAKKKRIPTGSVFQRPYIDRQGQRQLTATYYIKFYRDGKPVTLSTHCSDYEEALAMLQRKMAERLPAHHGELERVCVGHLLDLVIADHKLQRRKSRMDAEKRIDKHLRRKLGDVLAVDLSPAAVRRYAAERVAEDAAPATVNKELAILRRALRLGTWEQPPLVAKVPKIAMLPVDNVREGTLTHQQYRAVRDLLPSYARIALVIAYHTGARKGEIVSIRREHIDLAAGRILRPGSVTKNGRARYLPIYGEMAAELEMAVAAMRPSCPWLIQETTKGYRNRPGRTSRVESFRKAWSAACAGAGIAGALFHDLRRTAVTNMIEAGFSEKEAMEISGHKTRSVFDRYHIVSERRLREMGERLGAHLAGKEEAARKVEGEKPQGRVS